MEYLLWFIVELATGFELLRNDRRSGVAGERMGKGLIDSTRRNLLTVGVCYTEMIG